MPDHFDRIARLLKNLKLAICPTCTSRQIKNAVEMRCTLQFPGDRLQFADQIVNDSSDRMRFTGEWINQFCAESEATCPPFVLANHHRVAVMLIGAVIDFV